MRCVDTAGSLAVAPIGRRFLGCVVLGVGLLIMAPSALLAESPQVKRSAGSAATSKPRDVRQLDFDDDEPPFEHVPRPLSEPPPLNEPPADRPGLPESFRPEQLVSPGGLNSTVNLLVVMTVLSLAPSILIMTTCFIRFSIVLGLLRQALGTPQLPPNQVLMALSLFLTFLVMAPVWRQSYDEGLRPYTSPAAGDEVPTLTQTFDNSVRPIRRFMSEQISRAGNDETVWMLLDFQSPRAEAVADDMEAPHNYDDVPLPVLLSAYVLSELKVGFLIGFQIFLPFLVIDMVVATVLMSMGMMMVPPTLVSLPAKLLLFVLIDGWALTVGKLLSSVQSFG